MTGFFQTFDDIFETIEDAIEKGRPIPSLILLYSAIDSFSTLANLKSTGDRNTFVKWVKKWMIDRSQLSCSAMVVYSARCALLHQQTSKSDLTKKGEAKEVLYAWGNMKTEALQTAINQIGKSELAVVVKIEDLLTAFRKGMADSFDEIQEDEVKSKKFNEEAKKMFVLIHPSLPQKLVITSDAHKQGYPH